jgi:signal recognition particle receptor subunit beta
MVWCVCVSRSSTVWGVRVHTHNCISQTIQVKVVPSELYRNLSGRNPVPGIWYVYLGSRRCTHLHVNLKRKKERSLVLVKVRCCSRSVFIHMKKRGHLSLPAPVLTIKRVDRAVYHDDFQPHMTKETLIIGTSASGKTILVRQLRQLTTSSKKKKKKSDDDTGISFQTKPTVGVELDTITVNKQLTVTLREVGSPMAPMWSAFHQGCSGIIYLVDSSNHSMLPEAAVELWHTMASENVQQKPLLIAITKIDVPSLLSQQDILDYLRVTDLQAHHKASVDVLYLNLTLSSDCQKVLNWFEK